MAVIGLSNIRMIKEDTGEEIPIKPIGEIKLSGGEYDDYNWLEDVSKPISIDIKIHPKRKGTLFEENLYYQKNKKKRIRKKYKDRFERVLGIRGKK